MHLALLLAVASSLCLQSDSFSITDTQCDRVPFVHSHRDQVILYLSMFNAIRNDVAKSMKLARVTQLMWKDSLAMMAKRCFNHDRPVDECNANRLTIKFPQKLTDSFGQAIINLWKTVATTFEYNATSKGVRMEGLNQWHIMKDIGCSHSIKDEKLVCYFTLDKSVPRYFRSGRRCSGCINKRCERHIRDPCMRLLKFPRICEPNN